MNRCTSAVLILLLFVLIPKLCVALDASDLEELLGYTMIASTHVQGDFEGADFDKPILLENGMLFQFSEYNYAYDYRPYVAIFARTFTPEELRKAGVRNVPVKPFTVYKLVIDDEIYDAVRVR